MIQHDTGIYSDMPFDEYLSDGALSKSSAVHLLQTGMHYQHARKHPREPSTAMTIGQALHCKLSDDRHCLAVLPKINRRTNAGKIEYQSFLETHSGQIIVTPEQDDQTEAMAQAIAEHPFVRKHQSVYDELSLFSTIDGIRVKARLDRVSAGAILDWKSTSAIDDPARDAARFHYDLQAVWYRRLAQLTLNKTLPFYFVFVESAAPYSVRVMSAGESMLVRGEWHMEHCLRLYKECTQTNTWPGYPTDVTELELPQWARLGVEDVLEL